MALDKSQLDKATNKVNNEIIKVVNKTDSIVFLFKLKNLSKIKNLCKFESIWIIIKSNFLILNTIKIFNFLK